MKEQNSVPLDNNIIYLIPDQRTRKLTTYRKYLRALCLEELLDELEKLVAQLNRTPLAVSLHQSLALLDEIRLRRSDNQLLAAQLVMLRQNIEELSQQLEEQAARPHSLRRR